MMLLLYHHIFMTYAILNYRTLHMQVQIFFLLVGMLFISTTNSKWERPPPSHLKWFSATFVADNFYMDYRELNKPLPKPKLWHNYKYLLPIYKLKVHLDFKIGPSSCTNDNNPVAHFDLQSMYRPKVAKNCFCKFYINHGCALTHLLNFKTSRLQNGESPQSPN